MLCRICWSRRFFFFNDTATTEIYTLSLHDALPICVSKRLGPYWGRKRHGCAACGRSEEHTSELQSPCNLVCRLLLEKKKILGVGRNRSLLERVKPIAPSRIDVFSSTDAFFF